ncbi:MAG: hypothetical protein Kow00128_11220 [Deltaproteobacteria bacterium]
MTAGRRGRILLAALAATAILGTPLRGSGADRPDPRSLLPQGFASGLTLGGPVTLTAERLSYDDERGVAEAEGNVEVGFGGRSIRADRIRYEATTGEAEFTGHVHYEDGGDEFSFERIVLNIRTEQGVLYNGSIRIRSKEYRIASERFEKTGPRTFLIRKGTLTTCPCDGEPDWKFKVGRSRVTLDGYALAKDITFQVKGIPVVWLPVGAFPVKLSRQSGILLPSVSRSPSRGYSIQVPLYWAINRWSDATLLTDIMTRRGIRPEAEYRFVLNPESYAAVRGTLHRDRIERDTRYRLYGEHSFRFGDDFVSNARWDLRSDDRYYEDLVDEDLLRTGRHSVSRGFAALQGSRGAQALSVTWVQDNQGTPDDNTVQRLPEYEMVLLSGELGSSRVEASGALSAVWFYRSYGDREARGRGFLRLSRPVGLHPAVAFFPFLAVDLYGTLPTSDKTGVEAAGRAVPVAGASLSMTAARDYPAGEDTVYSHQIGPIVEFRWIPRVDSSRIPPTEAASRIQPQSQFHFGLNQRLIRKDRGGPQEVGFVELSWAVDARERTPSDSPYIDPYSPYVRALRDQIDLVSGGTTRQTRSASDLYGRFSIRPANEWTLSGETLYDPAGGDFTVAATRAEYRRDPDNRILAEYRISRGLAEDVNGEIVFRPVRWIRFRTTTSYSIRNEELTEGSAGVTLYPKSDCWSIGLVANRRTRPDETSFQLVVSLKGIGSIGQ